MVSILPWTLSEEAMSQATGQPAAQATLKERVEAAINLIRPAIQADGGDVELVEVTSDGIVKIRFHGACIGCPSANMTLYGGIRRVITDRVAEVKQVLAMK
jgi:Fe-S cluster biogenesis protein NfuA